MTGEGEGKEGNACPQTSPSLCRGSRVEDREITNKGYAAKLAIKGFALDLTLSTFPSFWLGGPTHLHEMEAMKNETYYFNES